MVSFLHAYNFVPIEGDAPEQQKAFRPHGALSDAETYSGTLRCRLTPIRRVFVGGERAPTDVPGHKHIAFYKLNGRPALPPTSLKGVIRSVHEAATHSCLSKFDGTAVQKRDPDGNWARRLCRGRLERQSDGTWKVRVMASAWVNQRLVGRFRDGGSVSAVIDAGANRIRRRGPIDWSCQVTQIFEIGAGNAATPGDGQILVDGYLKKNGVPLTLPGNNPPRKHDERVFFELSQLSIECLPDGALQDNCEGADPGIGQTVEVDPDVIARYQRVRDEQHGAYEAAVQSNHYTAPVPFDAAIPANDLVYFQFDNGKVAQISRTGWPRFEMPTSRRDLVAGHLPCRSLDKLCAACRLFGMVEVRDEPSHNGAGNALAGRVFFSHAVLSDQHDGTTEEMILPILSSPKPTASEFYLESHPGRGNYVAWERATSENARIRGRKFYRHGTETFINQRSDQNATIDLLRGAPAPQVFEFSVRFEDLDKDEIGALVWAVSLHEPDGTHLAHKVGMGKPVGLGSCKVEIIWAEPPGQVTDPHGYTHLIADDRYTTLQSPGRIFGTAAQQEMETARDAWRGRRTDVAFAQLREMLTPHADDAPTYPELPNMREGFEWFQEAARLRPRPILPAPAEERGGYRLMTPPGNNAAEPGGPRRGNGGPDNIRRRR